MCLGVIEGEQILEKRRGFASRKQRWKSNIYDKRYPLRRHLYLHLDQGTLHSTPVLASERPLFEVRQNIVARNVRDSQVFCL
jgi:hypothetical protein